MKDDYERVRVFGKKRRAVRICAGEADERLRCEELMNPPTGYEVTVPDREGNPTTLGVTTHQERRERAERELAQVWRKLSPSSVTAITVLVTLGEEAGRIGTAF